MARVARAMTTSMSDKTIFAKIIDREIPADIVYEDEQCLAFRDINPVAPVHVLVIPKKPIDMIANMGADDEALVGHLFTAANTVAKELGLADGGYRLVMNNGAGAGQTVFHVHLHVIGGRDLSWPPG